KAFHAQAELGSYCSQIHLLLLVVYPQQFREILMDLLLAFKKRPPVNTMFFRVCPTSLTARSGQIWWIMDAPPEIGDGLVNLDRAAAVLSLRGSHRGCVPGGAALACLSRLANYAARRASACQGSMEKAARSNPSPFLRSRKGL